MRVRVGINGMGRIGRDLMRIATDRAGSASETAIEVVAVNDLAPSETLAHLLRHDSTYGAWSRTVEVARGRLDIDGHEIRVLQQPDPEDLPWEDLGVDVVVEATGLFRTRAAAAAHLRAGARKVVITAPGTDVDATIVMGINQDTYDALTARRDLQRLLHHELRGTDGPGTGRLLRDRVGAAHHRAQLHRRPEPPRRPAQGPAPRPVGRRQHHPDQHRRREGRRPRAPPAGRTARRGRRARTRRRRLAGRPHRPARRAATAAQVNAAFQTAAEAQLKGILRCTEEPVVSHDVIGERVLPARRRAHPRRRSHGQGLRLVRQRVGLRPRTVDLVEMVARLLPAR